MKVFVKRRLNIGRAVFVAVFMVLATVSAFQFPARAANTFPPYQYELVTVNNTDGQGLNRSAGVAGVSTDGSKILFQTDAANLPQAVGVANVMGGYIRDMNTATTTRIDLSASGVVPNQSTVGHVMSTSGRYVAFGSKASNIIDGSSFDNSVSRVYFKDLQTNAVELLTNFSGITIWTPNGTYAGVFSPLAVSDDGRFVLVMTNTINSLIPGTRTVGGLYYDLALYDRSKSAWTLVNKSIDNASQNQSATDARMSCDGSLIVFTSAATNLTDNHVGSGQHVFLADLRGGQSIKDITPGAVGDSVASDISCNGRYVTYSTLDRALINPTPSGLSEYTHLVRYDRITGERKYIDSASDNTTFSTYHDAYQYGKLPSSVSDLGDVILTSGVGTDPNTRKVYFKHLSDGSGTLAPVQDNYAGLIYNTSSITSRIVVSPNSKYVFVSSKDGQTLGILDSANMYDILRIKTGL